MYKLVEPSVHGSAVINVSPKEYPESSVKPALHPKLSGTKLVNGIKTPCK